jgi:hypothetical protein
MNDRPNWSVPLQAEDVPEGGRDVSIEADAPTRLAIARMAGLLALSRLQATFHVQPRGAGRLHVTGSVSASIEQSCVVTLEPLASDINEPFDILFDAAVEDVPLSREHERLPGQPDPPEPLVDGVIDLGEIATEFLLLGIDPYPRKPDAAFSAPLDTADDEAHPFSALAALKKDVADKG